MFQLETGSVEIKKEKMLISSMTSSLMRIHHIDTIRCAWHREFQMKTALNAKTNKEFIEHENELLFPLTTVNIAFVCWLTIISNNFFFMANGNFNIFESSLRPRRKGI